MAMRDEAGRVSGAWQPAEALCSSHQAAAFKSTRPVSQPTMIVRAISVKDGFWRMLLKKSKIEQPRKSRKC
jgi:hypothetical protein